MTRNGEKNAPDIREADAPEMHLSEVQERLQPYLLAARELSMAGECLDNARNAMDGQDNPSHNLSLAVGSLDLVLARLKIVAVDVSLAAEEYDPDDQVGKVFSQSVFA